jgi:hypothetical protein
MERPSSEMSSAYRRRLSPEVHDTAQLRRYPNDQLELNSTSFPNGPRQGHSVETSETSELRSLDKLLGRDCNYYMEQHMGQYEAVRKKWDECSIGEWKAGADGIYLRKPIMPVYLVDDLDSVVCEVDQMFGFRKLFSAISSSCFNIPQAKNHIEYVLAFRTVLDLSYCLLRKKLKAYSKFNTILDSHDAILRKRKKAMELAQLKLVKDSGNVFQ